MGFVSKWLSYPAVLGVCVQAFNQFTTGNAYSIAGIPTQPIMSYLIVFWAVGVMEFWKQEEKFRFEKSGNLLIFQTLTLTFALGLFSSPF